MLHASPCRPLAPLAHLALSHLAAPLSICSGQIRRNINLEPMEEEEAESDCGSESCAKANDVADSNSFRGSRTDSWKRGGNVTRATARLTGSPSGSFEVSGRLDEVTSRMRALANGSGAKSKQSVRAGSTLDEGEELSAVRVELLAAITEARTQVVAELGGRIDEVGRGLASLHELVIDLGARLPVVGGAPPSKPPAPEGTEGTSIA
mmetsp:Transcript_40705/g.81618  ORF Transcript_40705/g.81618 Transcript_40705/m.81618 type:complete len:207 (-) Transcript_40705:76-696(-)